MRNNQSRAGNNRPASPSPAPVQNNLAYTAPTEFVVLPSRGKFYHEGHPLHGQETVEIRYMTAKDEDILSSTALIKKGLAIDRLLESIIVPDLDPDTLLIGDRNAIMIAARISSYGQDYSATTLCPSCETAVPHLFDLGKSLLIENCFEEDFLEKYGLSFDEESKTYVATLPVSNVEVCIKMLNGIDEKNLADVDEDRSITSILSAIIDNVDGQAGSKEVESFIENMPARDSKFLRDLFSLLTPGISLKQEFICGACFYTQQMEVPLTAEFFWP